MENFSSSEPIGKIEGPPKSEEGESDYLEQGPEKLKGKDNPSLTRPVFTGKQETQKEEKKEKEPPLKFKGSFGGGTIKAKYFSFLLGRKQGYKDFKAYGVKKDVREEMEEFRKRFASTGGDSVRKDKLQIEANRLRRELPHMQGDKHTAAVKFLKELEDKTGIKPR